ncbi:MAG: sigma-70 family RNA polymerase sigma factor [Rhizomicrobium sp.]|jgi:RNA polymerase sigma-70 factor (ECF subfamily)
MREDLDNKGFWADVLRRIRKRTRYNAEAEDLLHNAYLKLFAYRKEQDVKKPVAFMVQVAANQAIDIRRHRERVGHETIDTYQHLQDHAPLQDEVLAHRERLRRVQGGLKELTPRTREIFVMHKIQGMTHKEIARQLGISTGAVEKHVAKAMLFLTEFTKGW